MYCYGESVYVPLRADSMPTSVAHQALTIYLVKRRLLLSRERYSARIECSLSCWA